jgi:hypothetical protein
MGNGWKRHLNLEELKPAELHELTGIDFPRVSGILKKYEGYGDTVDDALSNLVQICEKHGLSVPTQVNGIYIIGTIKVHYFFKTKLRLNPIFIREVGERHIAFFYHQ